MLLALLICISFAFPVIVQTGSIITPPPYFIVYINGSAANQTGVSVYQGITDIEASDGRYYPNVTGGNVEVVVYSPEFGYCTVNGVLIKFPRLLLVFFNRLPNSARAYGIPNTKKERTQCSLL